MRRKGNSARQNYIKITLKKISYFKCVCPANRIYFKGAQKQLAYFLHRGHQEGIFEAENIWSHSQKHFLVKKASIYKAFSISYLTKLMSKSSEEPDEMIIKALDILKGAKPIE